MTKGKTCVCLAILVCPALADATEDKPAVPVYTNEDLERVRPFRDETGVASVPAFPPDERPRRSPGSDGDGPKARGRGADRHSEAYWRTQAERVRERLRKLEDQAGELRRRIAAARLPSGSSGRRRTLPPDTSAWQARIAALEGRQREIEGDLLDRARRDGALPGWLR